MFVVSGANGFIGRRLCKTLYENGRNVVGLVRRAPEANMRFDHLSPAAVRYCIGDVTDKAFLFKSLHNSKFCFHLAGLAKPWSRNVEDFYRINVEGTRNILEAAVANDLEKFVFVSTAGIFGPCKNVSDVLDESSIGDAALKTDYERSKLEAENVVREFAEISGLDCVIVNPTRVYGPGVLSQSNSITMIVSKWVNGKRQFLPDSNRVGDFVYVDDVVNGMLLALEKGRSGSSYILGGESVAWNQLLELVQEAVGHASQIVKVPEWCVSMAASFYDLRAMVLGWPPMITRAFVRKYQADYHFSSARAKEELGYEPIRLSEGLLRTAEWLRHQANS